MRKWIVAAALVALIAPATALPQANSNSNPNSNTNTSNSGSKSGVYDQLNLFGEAFERIRQDAVDPVSDDKLIDTAISGMLSGLDPHSVYMTEAEYKATQAPATDQSASTGLVVTLDNGQVKVVSPRDGSPAASADVKPGDIIFTIDKEPTYDLTLPEIEQKLRGPAGSEVTLMLRRGTSAPTEVKIKRANSTLPTVTGRIESGDIGYVRIAGFDDQSGAKVTDTVNQLRQQAGNKLIGFVIDLRNNPGGSFDGAVAAADAFIDKGDIAVIKSRKGDNAKHVAATPGDVANGLPMVALVNGGTAREAELVAGALQDNKRAVLLGTKTYGESAIETVIPLNGNGAIKLTTARYLTPSGRTIQGKGLDPDLTVSPLKLEKMAQIDRRREADLRGALKNPDDKTPAPDDKSKVPAKDANTTTATPPKGDQPTVASGDIGTPSDEQLSEAEDVLRGLALVSGRTASAR